MNIKDSYLHSDTPVIKLISVNADKLTYTLADKTESTKEITLPLATTSANGLLSNVDKGKLNKLNFEYINDVVTYKIQPNDNGGRSTFILIAKLTDWKEDSSSNYGIVGRFTAIRGGNMHNTGVYNLVALADSYPGTTSWEVTHRLYVDCFSSYGVLLPYIVSYNGANYIALKKSGSSTPVYFEGIVRNILPLNEWQELKVEQDQTLPSGMTIVEYPTYDNYYITTNKYYDGSATRTLLHNGNLNFITSGKNYAVKLNDNSLYVSVPWTDTKNTAGSTNSENKLFLIGATTQNDNPQTYSNSGVYATNGDLVANSFRGSIKGGSIQDVNTAYKDLHFQFYQDIAGCDSTVSTDGKRYAGKANSYGFPVSDDANSMLWLGAHIGVCGDQLGFSRKGIFHRRIDNNKFPTNVNGGSWEQIAYTSSDITGNATSADKLRTTRNLWGQSFDGSADVSGSLTGVTSIGMDGDIIINDDHNHDRYIKWLYNNNDDYGWRIGYLGDNNAHGTDNNALVFQSHKNTSGWDTALKFDHGSMNAIFKGSVTAPTFKGNLDWSYITGAPNFVPTNHEHNYIAWAGDSRNTATLPSDYLRKFTLVGIKTPSVIGLTSAEAGSWVTLIGWKGYGDNSGPYSWELASGGAGSRLFVRNGLGIYEGKGEEKWNSWNTIAYTTTNFPSNQIDKLTGYTKADTIGPIAADDSLNTALGKLEYKADWACDWITSVTADDTDTLVNKWEEIVDFLDSVAEGTDITNEFVTTKTAQTIIGLKTFKNLTTYQPALILLGILSDTDEDNQDGVSLGMSCDKKTNDGATTTHSGYFIYKGDSLYQLTNNGGNTKYNILHSGNSGIDNGVIKINGSSIEPMTSDSLSESLSNYVTIIGELTISGKKSFSSETDIYSIASNGFNYGVRLLGDGTAGYLQLGQITSDGNTVHNGHITGISGFTLASLVISSNTTSFTGNITTSNITASGTIEATGTIKTTGVFDGDLDGNAKTATIAGCIPMVQITKESDIVDSTTIRGYFGSSGGYDTTEGKFGSLKYSALLSVGSIDRGFRLWISRYERDYSPGFHYTVGDKDNPAWVDERVLLDTYNFNTYVPTLKGVGASGTWGISISGNAVTATTAASLKSTTIKESLIVKLNNVSWVDTGYTFTDLPTGTYAVQVTSGSNLVASGIMSIYNNLSDTVGDEIPLHVYGTADWRPYLRTNQNKLEISSTDIETTSRTITIKIAQIL